MKRSIIATLLIMCATAMWAHFPNGFGGTVKQPDWKDINYVGDDMAAHCLDIYLPENDGKKHKVVIAIYGSAWFSNNMKGITYMSIGKPLTDAGFAVVCINHRSSGDAKFPAQIHDVKAAVRFIRANADKYSLDTSFIGITGFSSGGHLAALAGVSNGIKTRTEGSTTVNIEGNLGEYTSESSDVNAVVDWFGPVDMSRMENCETMKDEKSPEAALIGGAPAEMPDMIRLISPITYVGEKTVPFLVIHGQADNVVPHCQGVYFSDVLREAGKLKEFISVPDGQHGPTTFNSDTFRKMTDFFIEVAK